MMEPQCETAALTMTDGWTSLLRLPFFLFYCQGAVRGSHEHAGPLLVQQQGGAGDLRRGLGQERSVAHAQEERQLRGSPEAYEGEVWCNISKGSQTKVYFVTSLVEGRLCAHPVVSATDPILDTEDPVGRCGFGYCCRCRCHCSITSTHHPAHNLSSACFFFCPFFFVKCGALAPCFFRRKCCH